MVRVSSSVNPRLALLEFFIEDARELAREPPNDALQGALPKTLQMVATRSVKFLGTHHQTYWVPVHQATPENVTLVILCPIRLTIER